MYVYCYVCIWVICSTPGVLRGFHCKSSRVQNTLMDPNKTSFQSRLSIYFYIAARKWATNFSLASIMLVYTQYKYIKGTQNKIKNDELLIQSTLDRRKAVLKNNSKRQNICYCLYNTYPCPIDVSLHCVFAPNSIMKMFVFVLYMRL